MKKMKRSNIIVILMVIGAYLFASCGSKELVSLESNAWKMVSMDGKGTPVFSGEKQFYGIVLSKRQYGKWQRGMQFFGEGMK